MAAIDFTQFHELAEQFRGEMPLKKICEQEGASYRKYLSWRKKKCLELDGSLRLPFFAGEICRGIRL